MRAWFMDGYDGVEHLRLGETEDPAPGPNQILLRLRFAALNPADAFLAQEPALVEASASNLGPALAESAKRALMLCQPFTMLKPEHYEQWKDLQLDFDPHELLGG